jgi:hypothetical protein
MQPTSPPPRRRRHLGTWIVVILALLEIGGLAAFIAFRDRACTIIAAVDHLPAAAMPAAAAGGAAVAIPGGGGGGGLDAGTATQTAAPVAAPSATPPAAAAGAGTAANAAANPGDIKTQGDTNQVPDPNCVGKTAAGLLNSNAAQTAPPSCAPMSPPPALKQAEQQVQAGATP